MSTPDSTPAPASRRDRVFISYSHLDHEWLSMFRKILDPDKRNDRIDYWEDRDLKPGDPWYADILESIDRARAAILLVSPNFLKSKFIMEVELPRILEARAEGLAIFWVPSERHVPWPGRNRWRGKNRLAASGVRPRPAWRSPAAGAADRPADRSRPPN